MDEYTGVARRAVKVTAHGEQWRKMGEAFDEIVREFFPEAYEACEETTLPLRNAVTGLTENRNEYNRPTASQVIEHALSRREALREVRLYWRGPETSIHAEISKEYTPIGRDRFRADWKLQFSTASPSEELAEGKAKVIQKKLDHSDLEPTPVSKEKRDWIALWWVPVALLLLGAVLTAIF